MELERKHVVPTNDEEWLQLRAKNINSTEVSALFGLSPYMTEYELWHQKKDAVVIRIEENERMKWGKRLQFSIAEGICEDSGWELFPMPEYTTLSGLNIGSSFDYLAACNKEHMQAILEVKNVDGIAFKEGWKVDGENVEAPVHIELQVQHQLLVSGLKEAYIGALIGGNKPVVIHRLADEKVQSEILAKCVDFWKSIALGIEPKPDFQRDSEFIISRFQNSEAGKVLDKVDDEEFGDLAIDYKQVSDQIEVLTDKKKAIKAKLLMLSEGAEKVLGECWTISMKMIKDCPIEASVRKGHRDFRINWKKETSK